VDTSNRIYLDYAATTPVDPRVFAAMSPYFSESFGNPSSTHLLGQKAEAAMENARQMVARSLNCKPEEIIFTSGGTESDNLALRGAAFKRRKLMGANHILISPVEHHAVTHTARQLAEDFGFTLEYLPVDAYGRVAPEDVEALLRPETAVVSVIYANNEIGTINPIKKIAAVCKRKGVPFHTDAVQAAAHLPIDLQDSAIDLMAIGAHKFYGPKGVGALFVRKGTPIQPVQTGGGQESGLRAGTQNVPYITGMAEALKIAQAGAESRRLHLQPLRDFLIGHVLEAIPQAYLSGHSSERLPNHASFVFDGVDGNSLLGMLDMAGFACSSGSACKTGSPEPSDVLLAIGLPRRLALGSLRVTLGQDSTEEHIRAFLKVLPGLVERSRTL
jgi:cysteine desulfurase